MTFTRAYSRLPSDKSRQCGPEDHAAAIVRFTFASKKSVLVFELAESSQDENESVHPQGYKHINRSLLQKSEGAVSAPRIKDVFGTTGAAGECKKFSVQLSHFGAVSLRSLSHTHGHQFRYGLVEDKACPVTRDELMDFAAALTWLGEGCREGRTWTMIDGTCGFSRRNGKTVPRPAVLFCYPSSLSEVPPELAMMLGGAVNPNDPDGVRFEALAARVLPALRGKSIDSQFNEAAEIRLFVLARQDHARSKLIAGSRFGVENFARASLEWEKGCENIPPIRIRRTDTDGHPQWQFPFAPTPADMIRCLNFVWTARVSRSLTPPQTSPSLMVLNCCWKPTDGRNASPPAL